MRVELTLIDPGQWEAYHEQGACVVRGVLSGEWIERMQKAVDRILQDPGPGSVEYTPQGRRGRYYGDFFVWRRDADFAAFMRDSPLPRLAAEMLQATRVRFFYDQLLVKEPCTREVTPLHQDLAYWPIRGRQILSIWVGFDPVTEDAGAVQYLAGSHRWGKLYAPTAFGEASGYAELFREAGLEPMPDPDRLIRDAESLHFDLEPGDVVLHHPLVLHHAPGNRRPEGRRRGLALRYVGEDVTFDARPGTFLQNPRLAAMLPPLGLRDGEPLSGELFPEVWSL